MADKSTSPEITDAEKQVNPPITEQEAPGAISMEPGTVPDGYVAPEPEMQATDRLRAFEDKHLGPDAVRIGGHVERGIGSAYHLLVQENPARQAQYEALERLVASEQKLAAAHTALIQADVEHEEAMAAAARAESDADATPAT